MLIKLCVAYLLLSFLNVILFYASWHKVRNLTARIAAFSLVFSVLVLVNAGLLAAVFEWVLGIAMARFTPAEELVLLGGLATLCALIGVCVSVAVYEQRCSTLPDGRKKPAGGQFMPRF